MIKKYTIWAVIKRLLYEGSELPEEHIDRVLDEVEEAVSTKYFYSNKNYIKLIGLHANKISWNDVYNELNRILILNGLPTKIKNDENKKIDVLNQNDIKYFLQNERAVRDIKYKWTLSNKGVEIDEYTRSLIIYAVPKKIEIDLNKELPNDVIDELKRHYQGLIEDLVKLSVAMRVNRVNKKKSFFYINAPSNFGKTFLISAFEKVGWTHRINIDDLIKHRGTASTSTLDLVNSPMLYQDEFTVFYKEFKEITHEVAFAEKFQMQSIIPVGLKVLMSAELSPSIDPSGMDSQIVNRLMFFQPKERVPIDNNELFLSYGKELIHSILCEYIKRLLKSELDKYKNIERRSGDMEVQSESSRVIDELNKKYELKAKELEDTLFELLYSEMFAMAIDDERAIKKYPKEIISLVGVLDNVSPKNKYYKGIGIKSLGKVLEAVIKMNIEKQRIKTFEYKIGAIKQKMKEKYKVLRTEDKKLLKLWAISLDELREHCSECSESEIDRYIDMKELENKI